MPSTVPTAAAQQIDKALFTLPDGLYTLLMYYFLRVKKAHPVLLIGVTFVLSIVCSAFGILVNGTRHCVWRCLFTLRNFILCKPFSKLKTIRR